MILAQPPVFGRDEIALQNQRDALILELDRAKTGEFYLLIDLAAKRVHLKANGNILRTCPILAPSPTSAARVQIYRFARRVDPVSVEPGNANLRLRGRRLPLDFFGRLIEGPRRRSRLYFAPALVLQSSDMPTDTTPYLALSPADVKALGSALCPGNAAILIPPSREVEL